MAPSAPKKPTRTLDRALIVEAALQEMDLAGEVGFSLRKVAARAGCDPMAVIYHLGSREGLERAVADKIISQVPLPEKDRPWARTAFRNRRWLSAGGAAPSAVVPHAAAVLDDGPSDYVVLDRIYGCLDQTGLPLEQ